MTAPTQALDATRNIAPWIPAAARDTTSPLLSQTDLQDTLHARDANARDYTINALWDSHDPLDRRAAARMAGCSSTCRIYVNRDADQVSVWLNRCKHRMCPYCARARSAKVAKDLVAILRKMADPRLIVLTVKHADVPLREQLTRLRRSFARLRRKRGWLKAVKGGAYTLEITLNDKTGLWHPHIHIIYDGSYLPQRMLQQMWHTVTGDSEIVWISRVDDLEEAANELCKYIGKPQKVHEMPPVKVCEYRTATSGCRMVQTFGACKSQALKDSDRPDNMPANEYQIGLGRLVYLADEGHDTPIRILIGLAAKFPILSDYIYHHAPQLAPTNRRLDGVRRLMSIARCDPSSPKRSRAPPDTSKDLTVKLLANLSRMRLEDEQGLYAHRPDPRIQP